MSPQLRAEWKSIEQIPIDDTPGEGPHAVLKRVQTNARAATWAFHASTMRLDQDLRDLHTLPQRLGNAIYAQWLWNNWTSVLQVRRGKQSNRNVRLPRPLVEKRVYTQSAFADFKLRADFLPIEDAAHTYGDHDGALCDAEGVDDADGDERTWSGALLKPYYKVALSGLEGSFFTVPAREGSPPTDIVPSSSFNST